MLENFCDGAGMYTFCQMTCSISTLCNNIQMSSSFATHPMSVMGMQYRESDLWRTAV